jgi:EAL domain-containing protein (putative c-di-GMP-specific phosphodiesterase class I)
VPKRPWRRRRKVSVNVSPIQLMNTSLTDTIIEVLHQTGLDPRRLDLEITESDVFNENTRWKMFSCASRAFRSPSMTLVPAILPVLFKLLPVR